MSIFSLKKISKQHNDKTIFPNYQYGSLVEAVKKLSHQQPRKRLYTYLNDGEDDAFHITWGELDSYARTYASYLQEKN